MVKEKSAPTVYLEHAPRVEHPHGNIFEEVTEPDVSPSLLNMVTSATVGSMSVNSPKYQFPDLGDDDSAHEHPDYEKLDKLDVVDKALYVENWLENPNLYEKEKTDLSKGDAEGEPEKGEAAKAKPEQSEG